MVHSMTAFARVEKAGAQGTLSWELRSVNSRYLEPHLRLPESFRDLEGCTRGTAPGPVPGQAGMHPALH